MATFPSWSIPGSSLSSSLGLGGSSSKVDLTKPLYDTDDMSVTAIKAPELKTLSITGVKAPTLKERQAAEQAQTNLALAQNTQRYVDYYNQFADSSIEKKKEVFDDIMNNLLPNDIASNAAFQANPETARNQTEQIRNALTTLYGTEKKAIDDAAFYTDAAKVAGKQFGARLQGLGETVGSLFDGSIGRTGATRTERERYEKIVSDPSYSAEAKKFAQAKLDQMGTAPQPDEQFTQLTAEQKQQNQLAHAQRVAKARKEAEDYEANIIANNPAYRNEVIRQAELREADPNYMVGLSGSDYKMRHLSNLLIQTAPDIAMIAGASAINPVLGAGAAYASSLGGIQDQAVQAIMDAPLETLANDPTYQALKAKAVEEGSSEEEADATARTALGLMATSENAAWALAPATLELLGGPAGILGNTASRVAQSAGRMVGKGSAAKAAQAAIPKNSISGIAVSSATPAQRLTALEKFASSHPKLANVGRFTESALSEGVSEVMENAAAIHIANEALGTNTSLFNDWLSNFATGALVGGIFGAPALVGAHKSTGATATQATATGTNTQTTATQGEATAQGTTGTATQDTTTGTTQAAHAAQTGSTAGAPQSQAQSLAGQNILDAARSTPFYNRLTPEDQTLFAQSVTDAQNILHPVLSNTGTVDANIFSADETVALYNALTNMRTVADLSGQQGQGYIDNYLMQHNMGINANGGKGLLTFADIEQRAQRILDARAQQAQAQADDPAQAQTNAQTNAQAQTQTQQTQATASQPTGATNANQGPNQGASNAASSATNTQQGTANTAGQQNTTPATGSSATTQGTGTSGSAHPDTGTSATDVHAAQPENRGTAEGTDSGRDSSTDADTGTQSGAGNGSAPIQTEQRPSSGSDTEATGANAEAGTAVEQQSEATVEQQAPARTAEEEQRIQDFNEAHAAFEEVRRTYGQRHSAMENTMRIASGGDVTMGHLNNSILMNMQVMLEAALGKACQNLFAPPIIITRTGQKWYSQDNVNWTQTRPKGKAKATNSLGKGVGGTFNLTAKRMGTVFINVDASNPTTVMHELIHATCHYLRLHKDELYEQAKLGNPYAKQMVDAIDGIAKSLHISPEAVLTMAVDKGTYRVTGDTANKMHIQLEERLTKQFEVYLAERGYSDVNAVANQRAEFNEARNKFVTAITNIANKLYQAFATSLVNCLHHLGVSFKVSDVSSGTAILTLMGRQFRVKVGKNVLGYQNWLRAYGHPTADAIANGVDKDLLPFFDSLVKGLSEVSQTNPLDIEGLDAYQTRAMIEATSAKLATQYVANGMSMEQAFVQAHEKVLAMVQEQAVVEQTVAACQRLGRSSPALAESLATNTKIRDVRLQPTKDSVRGPFYPDFSKPEAAVNIALGTNIHNSLNMMGYTADATSADSNVVSCVATDGIPLAQLNVGLDATGAVIAPEQVGTIVQNNEAQLMERIGKALAGRNKNDAIANEFVTDLQCVADAIGLDAQSVLNAISKFHVERLRKTGTDVESMLSYDINNSIQELYDALHVKERSPVAYQGMVVLAHDLQSYHQRVTENTYAYAQGLQAKQTSGFDNKSLSDAMLDTVQINGHAAGKSLDNLSKAQANFFIALANSAGDNPHLQEILARNSEWFMRGTADATVMNAARATLNSKPNVRDAVQGQSSMTSAEISRYVYNASAFAEVAVEANLRDLDIGTRFPESRIQKVTADKQGQDNAVVADQVQRSMQQLFRTDAMNVTMPNTATAHASIFGAIREVLAGKNSKGNDKLAQFKQAVKDMETNYKVKASELFDAKHWSVIQTGMPECPIAFVPDFQFVGQGPYLQTITSCVNAVVRNSFKSGADSETTGTAWGDLVSQAQVNAKVNELSEQVGEAEAERLVTRAQDLNVKTPEEATETINADASARVSDELENNERIAELAADADGIETVITNEMTTDQELVNAFNGIEDPDASYINDLNSSAVEATGYETNGTNTDTAMSEVHEAQARENFASNIIDEINSGAQDTNVNDSSAQTWFENWFADHGITGEDGQPQGFYASGNRLNTTPSNDPNACEVFTYARAHNILEPKGQGHAKIVSLIERGNYAEAQIAMNDAGVDAVRLSDGSLWVANTASQLSYNQSEISPDFQPEMVAPQSQNVVGNAIAQMVYDQHLRYQQMAEARRQQNEKNLATRNVIMTPPQQAGWWHRMATYWRKQVTDWASDFRSWAQLNQGATVGNAETNPLYIAYTNMKQIVQGAREKIEQQVIAPYVDWCSSLADSLGMDKVTVVTELSSARTLLHTIEAAAKQEQELQKAVMDAYAMVNEPYPGARQEAIDKAETELKAYKEAQNGLTRQDPVTGKDVPFVNLYGGKTIAQATTEFNELVAKYGQDNVEQAVGRLGDSIDALVSYGIQQGVFSQSDVDSFGMWQFYTPLITKTKYEQGVVNDVISLFPSKMNWHRAGSSEPAVDGYTALAYIATRMANNVGSYDFGQELYRSYQDLASQHDNGVASVMRADTKIAGLDATYYNGLLVMPAGKLRAIAANEERHYTGELPLQAQRAIDSAAASIRVLVKDADGNERMESMLVWFNETPLEAKTGNGTVTTMDSHDAQQQAIHATFHRPADKGVQTSANTPNVFTYVEKVAGALPKLTGGMSSLCTVYNPGFWPVAFIREAFERTIFTANKVFRDANGKAVDGLKVMASYDANLAKYAKPAMQFALSGKVKDPNSKFARYANEAKELGLFTTGSIKKALANANKKEIAILEEYLGTLQQTDDVKSALLKLKDKGLHSIQAVSEAVYAPSLMAAYMSLREHGVDAKTALYYVTEVNNTNQEGAFIKKAHLGAFYPFLRPIAQSAAQILDYAGINAMSFGQGQHSTAQHKRSAKASAIVGVMSVGMSALVPLLAMAIGGGDEDEGYKILDQMSLDGFNYIPIPLGDGDMLKLPLGFGIVPFAWQAALGANRVARGTATIPEVAMTVTSAFINNLNPMGGPTYETDTVADFAKKMLMTVTPMPLQPVTQLAVNRDYWGNEIVADYAQADERASDHYKRRTPEFYRSLAKAAYDWFGIDMYPEQYRSVASGYGLGVMRGLMWYMEDDPLAKDPEYASTRDALGPVWSALGATSMYSKVGNSERRAFYNFQSECAKAIKDAGLHDAMKVTSGPVDPYTGKKFSATDRRVYILRNAGFSEDFIHDYATMYAAQLDVKKNETALRKALDNAKRNGGSAATYDALLREYGIKTNDIIRNANSNLSYGKTYQRTEIKPNEYMLPYARALGE